MPSFFSDKVGGAVATGSPAPSSDTFPLAPPPTQAPNGGSLRRNVPGGVHGGHGGHGGSSSSSTVATSNGALANTAASISLRPPRRPAEPFDLYVSEMRPS